MTSTHPATAALLFMLMGGCSDVTDSDPGAPSGSGDGSGLGGSDPAASETGGADGLASGGASTGGDVGANTGGANTGGAITGGASSGGTHSEGTGGAMEDDPVVIQNETNMGGVQAHTGAMIRVGEFYYWVGVQTDGDPKVNLYRSTDLKDWNLHRVLLTPASDPMIANAANRRCRIIHNETTRKFALWCQYGSEAMVAQADAVEGPYSVVRKIRPGGKPSMNMGLFKDDDGRAYYVRNGNWKWRHMEIFRLTADYLNIEGLVHTFPWHREAPALFKRNGVYFLMSSGRSGWKPNQQRYVTATNLAGPWSELRDVGGRRGYEGQTTWVQPIEGSKETTYLWMSDVWRQPEGGTFNGSDYKWLPLEFSNDTTMSMTDAASITVNTSTGEVYGN